MNKFTFDLKSRTLSSVSNYFFMMIMGLLVFSLQSNAQTNPLAPAYGFNIFVQNNLGIGPPDVEGGFAAGGNFIFSPSNSGASAYAGAATAGGVGPAFGTVSGINYAAVIGGNIDFPNSSNSFAFTMPNSTVLAKFGNLNGGTYAASKITNGAKFLQFNNSSQTTQASFVQTGIINFATQFSTLTSTSSCLSALIDNTPNISGSTYSVNLSSAPAVSVLNITGAQLTSLTSFTVTGASSAHILIINVNATSVTIPATLNQNNNSFAPFILWNFYNANSLSIGRLSGSLLAPLADVTKPLGSNNIDGQVVAKSYNQLAGETHIAAFNGTTTCSGCTKPNAGADQIACSGSSTTLTGTSPTTGTWSAQTGNPAGATLGTTTNGVATVSWATTAGGSYNFIYTSGTCTDTTRITVLTPVVASGNQNVCTNGVNTYCAVTNANVQYYEWNFGANATPLTSKNSCVDVSWSTAGTKTITLYYISLSGCSTNSVTYTVNVSKPDAGVDKSLTCITLGTGSVTMTATGTGTWSARTTPANPGTSTITNTTLATTTITGFSASGTYGYVWTNGSCTDTVLVNVTAKPVAGADKNLTCITLGSGSVAMTATGTGTWSARTTPANPGTSSITNTTLATTTITGFSATGTYGYVWTNGSCTDTVLVNVTAKPDAGIDKNACVILGSGSVTMTATGTGTWSIRTTPANPGTSAITTATSPTTTITGFSAVGTYGYVWTNGSCTDTVLINITNCSCTKPNAGADQTACSGSSTTLTGTSPTTGTWSAQAGNPAGATLGATTNGVASVSWATAAGGSYNFIYTSGTCTDTTRITVLTPVVASGNQNVCVNSLNTYCAVTNSNVQYYEWNFGTNATPQTSKNSCVDVSWSTAGTKTITLYYISLSGCSTNTITYTVNVSSKASAGTDQAVCGGNSAALTGTNPTTGTWTAQTGNPVGATLGSTTNGNAIVSFTNTASGIFSFIYNATGCPDTTKITVTPKPAAGVDKNACITLGSGSVAMTAVGTGTWTARTSPANPGTSNITAPGSATTTITGFSVVGTYGYVWSSGGCTDTVLINITSCGCTKPNAGTNQVGCSGTTSTLTGTSPTTGTWSAQTGNPAGATVGTTTGGIATITWANTASGNYNFIYTVGTCTDTTKITVLTPVVASGNQNVCVGTPITYCAVTDPNVQYYEWNFGTDASPQTSKNSCVDVTWSTPGTKTITLYYISLSGCSTNTISYTVNVGACCTGNVTSLYFSNGTATVPITNGASFNINTVSGLYYFEAGTSGSIGSIKYTISGPSASSNIENTAPYNSPGTGSGNWSGTEGTYSVNLKTYSAAGATGTICHDTTITFTLNNPACCTNSILTNPSFESGTTGWNFLPANSSTGASDFYTGTGFVMCGSSNAFLNAGGTTKSFYQQVNGVAPGTQYTLTIYGGTHQPSLDHSFLLSFYNISGVRLLKDSVQVDWDVDLAPGLQQYTLQGVAPAGTSYLRVEGKGTGDYLKVDMACLTVTSQPASLGDLVWNDINGNGMQDPGEPGIAGDTVRLTNTVTNITVTTITNASGRYLFSGLTPGTYKVTFATPSGFTTPSAPNMGGNDNMDSDPGAGGTTGNYTLGSGQSDTTVDAGFYMPVNLGNFVWYDQNNNGVQDVGEPGLAGATVTLYDSTGTTQIGSSITTGADGLYSFTNLTPGNYVVGVTPPAGYKSSAVDGGDPDNNINTDDNGTGSGTTETMSSSITLLSGSEPTTDGDGNNGNLTVDFGFAGTGSIGDYVWNDKDGNGLQGTAVAEPGVAGVIVTLTYTINGTAFTVKDTTDANGLYLFPNLPPATYTVVFSNVPAGMNVTTTDAGGNANDNTDSDGLTPPGITLTAGQNNLSIDLGLYTPVNLGNFVWYDQNNNGVQDAGEPGLAGASVQLYAANGTTAIGSPVITTTTGLYNFTNLAPGDYVVGVTPPAGYKSSAVDGGDPDNDINTDDNGTGSGTTETRSLPITLVSGSEPTTDGDGNNGNLTVDFGFAGTGSIGDYVWNDKDGNGLQGTAAAEPGVAGVIVTLTYTINGTAFTVKDTTDANGLYLFSNLPPATYTVVFSNVPAGMNVTTTDAGANANDNTDSDGLTPPGITLTAGQNNLSIDLGLYTPVNLGNFVWYDQNNNGVQDAGEPGLAGASVQLYAANGTTAIGSPVITTTTGLYNFTNLAPGDYVVGVTPPAGYKSSAIDGGDPDNDINTDDNGTGSGTTETKSLPITLVSGSEPTTDGDGNNGNLTVDFGFAGTGSIGDYVWNDKDGNGLQGTAAAEPGVAGVIVTLTYTINGTAFTVKDTTDANGLYLFSNLPPATYTVVFSNVPAGMNVTTTDAGANANDNTDSDGLTPPGITLTAGQNNLSIDLGLYQPAALGNFVWKDLNANGLQDVGEPGIQGVSVTLTNVLTSVNTPATTDVNGKYLFSGLVPGTYKVTFGTPSGGYFASLSNAGADDKDSDPVSGVTGNYVLVGGQTDTTVDAGFYQKASLGNYVWYDWNQDGIQNKLADGTTNEIAAAGVKMYLYSGTNVLLDSVTTDANGQYLFTNLTPGTYFVKSKGLSSYYSTKQDVGDNNFDSDFPFNSGFGTLTSTPLITLLSGATDLSWDLGLYRVPGNITDPCVWLNNATDGRNGQFGEHIRITATPGGVWRIVSQTGMYLTTSLAPPAAPISVPIGTIIPSTGLGMWDYSFIHVDSIGYSVVVSDGLVMDTVKISNFCSYARFKVIPFDTSLCVSDPAFNVTAFADVPGTTTFTLTNLATNAQTVFTGVININPAVLGIGNYKLTADFVVPAVPTCKNTIIITFNVSIANCPGALGNFVWNDLNANGIQDVGEPGISGASVTLTRLSDNTTTSQNTGSDGKYLFTGLTPGSYRVTFGTPTGGFVPTTANATADDKDSDAGAGGMTGSYTLTGGQTDSTVDAGFYIPARIGNFVWNDLNANGSQDPGEPGIPNVSVTLTNVTTAATTPTTTGSDGKYLFSNLVPGTYKVTFGTPSGYVATLTDVVTTTDDKDSDAGPGGVTNNYILVSGQVDTSVDAGFFSCPGPLTFPSQNICGTQKVNLNSLIPVGYEGGIWTKTAPTAGSVSNPLAVSAGTYLYTKIIIPGQCTVTGSVVINKIAPDYTPTIMLQNDTIHGVGALNLIFKISELQNVQACSDVYIIIPREGVRYSFVYDPFSTSIDGPNGTTISIQNEHWSYISSNPIFHVWKWVGNPSAGVSSLFPANHISYFGVNGDYDPLGTSGFTTFTVQIVQGSGGEILTTNNTDSKTLMYFSN